LTGIQGKGTGISLKPDRAERRSRPTIDAELKMHPSSKKVKQFSLLTKEGSDTPEEKDEGKRQIKGYAVFGAGGEKNVVWAAHLINPVLQRDS